MSHVVHFLWLLFQLLAASLACGLVILLWIAIVAMIREAVNGSEEDEDGSE